MKRTRFIALALVVAIMLMGAGYAAWSDQIFVTSTVKTGNFDMELTNASTRTGDDQDRNEVHDWHQYDWTHTDKVNFNKNSAVVEFSDLYPGGIVQIDMKAENMGTLPARLESVKVEKLYESKAGLFDLLRAQTSWKADINGDGTKDAWEHVEQWSTWRKLQPALNKLVESTDANNLVIEPNGWFTLGDGEEEGCIQIKLDPEAGNEFQNEKVKFKITLNWEQWATNPEDNPYDGTNGYGGDGEN